MFIPIFINSQPEEPKYCPNCQEKEEIVSTCKHCGYEYEEEETDLLTSIIGWVAFLIILFTIVTLISWSVVRSVHPYTAPSYIEFVFEALKSIVNWFSDLI